MREICWQKQEFPLARFIMSQRLNLLPQSLTLEAKNLKIGPWDRDRFHANAISGKADTDNWILFGSGTKNQALWASIYLETGNEMDFRDGTITTVTFWKKWSRSSWFYLETGSSSLCILSNNWIDSLPWLPLLSFPFVFSLRKVFKEDLLERDPRKQRQHGQKVTLENSNHFRDFDSPKFEELSHSHFRSLQIYLWFDLISEGAQSNNASCRFKMEPSQLKLSVYNKGRLDALSLSIGCSLHPTTDLPNLSEPNFRNQLDSPKQFPKPQAARMKSEKKAVGGPCGYHFSTSHLSLSASHLNGHFG